MHFITGTLVILTGIIINQVNVLLLLIFYWVQIGCRSIRNQPELYELEYWKEKVRKWWKHWKRKAARKSVTKQTGYYVYGSKKDTARVYYLSSKAMLKVREHMKRVHPVSCQSHTGGPSLYNETKHIGIDTLTTYCMTNCMNDYIQEPRDTKQAITGISDSTAMVTKVGKGIFNILDDMGMKCQIPIPELYYCSTAPYRIISPQHLDAMWQEQGMGTFEESTNGKHTRIKWIDELGHSHSKTI
jgi:hypothetical protein